MKALIQSIKTLFFVAVGLTYSFSDYGQIYQYTDNNSGTPFAVNANATGGNLTRGTGLNNTSLTCTGSTDGFGAKSLSTLTASSLASADASGDFISFTITPNTGYRLNITGFSAFLKSPTSPSGGPTTARYAYKIGSGALVESGAISPTTLGTSTSCANVGLQRDWLSFSPIVTTQTITFRIYGFNADISGNGELYLRNVLVSGTVECDPAITAAISPISPAICANNTVTLTGSTSGASVPTLTYAWIILGGGTGTGSLSSPTTNTNNLFTGLTGGTVNVQYTASYGACNVVSPTKVVTVNGLPTITLGVNPAVCFGTTSASLTYLATTNSPNVYTINYDPAANLAGFVDVSNQTLTTSPISIPTSTIAAGTYNATLIVENNATGCASQVYNFTITVHALPTVSITGASSVCVGSTTPLAGISSPSAVTSSWATSTSSVATVSSIGVVSGVAVGNSDITYTSTDGNGCTKTSFPFNVVVNPIPTGTLTFTETSGTTNDDGTVCSGDAVNFTATPGHTNYNFKIDGVSVHNSASNTYTGTFTANGIVTVEITNANTCMNTLAGIPITVGTCGVHNTTSLKNYVTIQAAINNALTVNGHTLEVASGTYNEQVSINKELIMKGVGLTKPIINFAGTVTGKPTIFDISADNVTIENLNFKVDLSKLKSAIIASAAGIDNIIVKDNLIEPYGAPSSGLYGDRNAISINYGGSTNYRIATGGVNNVTFTGNTVTYLAPSSAFRAGISVDEAGGTFSGNTLQTINHDILVRFGSNGAINITNNNFNGGGLESAEHNAAAGNLSITNNIFDATFANSSAPGTAVLRLKNNQTMRLTTVSGNTISNHQWAASLENYRDVTFNNNTFTPLSGSTTYQHIAINTKLFSLGSATNVQTAIDGTFTNNTFNGSGATGGKAFAFYNQDSDNAAFGTFTVGTASNENNFNTGIQNFIFFDGSTGNSVAPITPMAPWTQNLDASFNKFDVSGSLKLPSAMTFTERASLENALTHKPDNPALGIISYFKPVHNLTQNTLFSNIQPAIAAANTNDVIELSEWTFAEGITIDKPLTIQGVDSSNVILDGATIANANGITLANGIQNVIIKKLKIKNFKGANPLGSGIFGSENSNLMIDAVVVDNNQGRGGIFLGGGSNIQNVTIKNSISKNNIVSGSRGIVIWDGFKENITITGNKVYGNNCCGIELQDGSATGVTITGNIVFSNFDNGIGLIGLMGPGANIVSGNIVTNNGRFGMEIKNPNGNGLSSGAGSVVIDGNTVSRTIPIGSEVRDMAGIAVFRRGVTALNIDVPQGVVVKNNTVSGYVQPSNSDGFGIVVEGINHSVATNTVSGNDVGIQRQAGYLPYPGDGDQSNVSDTYFGRGNSPVSCGITLTGNTLSSNGVNTRDVGNSDGTGVVTNTNTNKLFCTIQSAISDVATVNGNTLEVASGNYNEQVLVNKELIIKGIGLTKPIVNFTGTATGKLTLFDVSKPNVTIENFSLSVDVTKLGSAILGSDATLSALTVKDNSINPYRSGLSTISFELRNAISINYGAYRVGGNNPIGLLIQGNTVSFNNGVDATAGTADDAGFRAGVASDVGVGTFTANTIQSISQDLELRFANPGNLMVTNNNINGGGLEISEHNSASGTVTVSGNTFNGTAGNTYTNILRLKNNQVQKPTTVSGNTFTNTVWAASLENYRDVTFNNNTFTPLSGSTTYQHIAINTKLFSSGSATNVQTAIDGTFTNNTFNGSGSTGGKAMVFNNHHSTATSYGTFTIGSSGNENNFNSGIQDFIFFDGSTGSSAGPIPATTMAPWAGNTDASFNKFDVSGSLKLPSLMTQTERISLETKLTHKFDNPALGKICLPISGTLSSSLTAICAGGSANLSVAIVSATGPFTLIYTDGTTPVTLTGYVSGTAIPITPSATKTYSIVSITDAIGCISTTGFTGTLTVTVNPSPTATISGTVSVCKNSTSPNITFTGANGSVPYTFTYKINGGADLMVTTIAGNSVTVAAPTSTTGSFVYTLVSVLDGSSTACSQSQTGTETITVNALPTAVLSGGGTICAGATLPSVSIALTGASPWSITYSDGANSTTISTSTSPYTITAATAGTYTVTALTDANTCAGTSLTGSAAVIVNPLPTVYGISGTGSICNGISSPITLSNSTIGVNYKLKTASFPYTGSVVAGTGAAITFTPPASPLGTFTVEATNATTGCVAQMSGSVTTIISTNPVVSLVSQTNVSCKTGNDGAVTISASAGTGTYNYTFNNGTPQGNGTFTGKAAGTYPLTAIDANTGCTGSINVTITEPASLPSATVAQSGTACVGNTITLTAIPAGGTPSYTYSWNGGTFSTTATFAVTASGTYILDVKDSKNCSITQVSTTVSFNAVPTPTITGGGTLCSGSTIALTATGGGTSFSWNGPNTFTSTSTSISILNATTSNSGIYTVTVMNANSCTAIATATVTINPIPATPTAQVDVNIPTGGSVSLTATGCSGGSGTYALKWYKSSDNSPVTMPVSPTVMTKYYAKCEQTLNGITCSSDKSGDVNVTIGDLIVSIKTGNWEDPTTWDVNRIPLVSDIATIDAGHTVTITTNNANAKRVEYRTNAVLNFLNATTKLKLGF